MGLPDAFKLATLIPSGLLALVKRIVRARIIAGWPLFVYPDSAFQQIDPAERRLHPFVTPVKVTPNQNWSVDYVLPFRPELVQDGLVVIEMCDGGRIGDDGRHDLAPFLRLADGDDLHARGGRSHGTVVSRRFTGVRQPTRIYFTGGVSAVLMGWRQPGRLRELHAAIVSELYRYPAVDPSSLARQLEQALGG